MTSAFLEFFVCFLLTGIISSDTCSMDGNIFCPTSTEMGVAGSYSQDFSNSTAASFGSVPSHVELLRSHQAVLTPMEDSPNPEPSNPTPDQLPPEKNVAASAKEMLSSPTGIVQETPSNLTPSKPVILPHQISSSASLSPSSVTSPTTPPVHVNSFSQLEKPPYDSRNPSCCKLCTLL